jgi:hypothetical protein
MYHPKPVKIISTGTIPTTLKVTKFHLVNTNATSVRTICTIVAAIRQVKFFKLKNQLIDEEVKYVLFQPVEISVFINETVKIVPDVITSYNEVSFYIDPPQNSVLPRFFNSNSTTQNPEIA